MIGYVMQLDRDKTARRRRRRTMARGGARGGAGNAARGAAGKGDRAGNVRRKAATSAGDDFGAWRPWLADLFLAAPVGIACLDLHGVVVACNTAFRALFADGSEGVIGRHFAELVARPDRDDLARQLCKLVLGTARSVRLEDVGIEAGDRARRLTLVGAAVGQG